MRQNHRCAHIASGTGLQEIAQEVAVDGNNCTEGEAHGIHALVRQQLHALDEQEELHHAIVYNRTQCQHPQNPEAAADGFHEILFPIQQIQDHAAESQGNSHRKIGLIGAHGAGQGDRAQPEQPGISANQPDGKHRQENGESVGGGGEHIQIGVGQSGEGSHKSAAEDTGLNRAQLQAIHDQRGRCTEKQQAQPADQTGRLQIAVEHGGKMQEPATGNGHLLLVKNSAQTIGVGDDVAEGKQMHHKSDDDGSQKSRPGWDGELLPERKCFFLFRHG